MKRTISLLFLCILITAFTCGCGVGNSGDQGSTEENRGTLQENLQATGEQQGTSEAGNFFEEVLLEEEPWHDNSLDAYSAVASFSLKPQEVGMTGGAIEYALANSAGAVFKKHIFLSPEECWDELKTVTDRGEEDSVRLSFREDTHNQAWGLGSIAGSDHFMMWDFGAAEAEERTCQFFEVDGQQQIVRRIPLDFLAGDGSESPCQIKVDQEGNIHFTTMSLSSVPASDSGVSKTYYIVVNAEGELLTKRDCEGRNAELVFLYDGRVGLCSQPEDAQGTSSGSRLEYFDAETGKTMLLVESSWSIRDYYYTLWNENTLLYADNKGLHFADLSGNNTGDLYIWSNHGIRFSEVEELTIREDGRINLIYTDQNRDGSLLCLEPTREQVEIQKIVFAVSPYKKDIFYPTVVEFNKKYPSYHIDLKTDYDRTALLTELSAGKGPVLIDTSLTGFEGNRKLWTSLEGLFAGEKWEEALIPKAMEMGEIDGTLYGAVHSFGLQTVVIAEDQPTDWDYQAFLDKIEGSPSIEAIYNTQNSPWVFMYYFLIHGLEDNYLLDAESGKTYFDSDEFRRVLRLSMKYCTEKEFVESVKPMLEGKVLCNIIEVRRPELIDMYRYYYGKDANYIGFPAKEGSAHYIYGNNPVTIRFTATDEEKRVAGTFLRLLLSQEGQSECLREPNFWMSVRWDVLEEQIAMMDERSYPSVYGFDQVFLKDEDYDREYDTRFLQEMLEKAQPKKGFPEELNAILMEEIEAYTAGGITEDQLIERLTGRVELYLAEQS